MFERIIKWLKDLFPPYPQSISVNTECDNCPNTKDITYLDNASFATFCNHNNPDFDIIEIKDTEVLIIIKEKCIKIFPSFYDFHRDKGSLISVVNYKTIEESNKSKFFSASLVKNPPHIANLLPGKLYELGKRITKGEHIMIKGILGSYCLETDTFPKKEIKMIEVWIPIMEDNMNSKLFVDFNDCLQKTVGKIFFKEFREEILKIKFPSNITDHSYIEILQIIWEFIEMYLIKQYQNRIGPVNV